ncbi:MAG: GNAT family N-acetyltransferase [Marinoscillum sp.]
MIGYYKMKLNVAQTERHYPNSVEIERIYVATGHKGKGLGKHMILHACETAQLANARYIWLGVWEKNPAAIAFYQKMGFEQIDTHMFQLGDDAQTDIIMKLNL